MSFKIPAMKPKIEAFVSFNSEPVDLSTIDDQSITLSMYTNSDIRANSAGHNALIKKFDNETLCNKVRENILPNCSLRGDVTYDSALQTKYVPELLNRIEELQRKVDMYDAENH